MTTIAFDGLFFGIHILNAFKIGEKIQSTSLFVKITIDLFSLKTTQSKIGTISSFYHRNHTRIFLRNPNWNTLHH